MGTFATDLKSRVKTLMDDCIAFANKCVKKGDPPHTSNVVIATAAKPPPGNPDYLVYLLPVEYHSICGAPTKDNLLADHWGFTKVESGGAAAKSEIIAKLTQGA